MNKLSHIEILENGKGIQFLLDSAHKIFNRPIAVFDINYDLKAYTDVVSDDPIWNELVSTGTFSLKTQEFFAQELFTEAVANTDKLVILKSSKLKHDRIVGYIFNKEDIKVALIVMVGLDTLSAEEDTEAFEKLADKISREIHDDEYFTAYGRAYHESIIVKLLDQAFNIPIIYTGYVQIILEGFEDYLYVAVVDITQSGIQQNKSEFFKKLIEDTYPSFKFAIYSDYIVIIMSAGHKNFHFFNNDGNFFKQNNLFVGVSSSFENPYELRKYYGEAVAALKNGIKSNTDQRVFFYK